MLGLLSDKEQGTSPLHARLPPSPPVPHTRAKHLQILRPVDRNGVQHVSLLHNDVSPPKAKAKRKRGREPHSPLSEGSLVEENLLPAVPDFPKRGTLLAEKDIVDGS